MAEISEMTIGFTIFYIVFLLFILFIVSITDVELINGISQADIESLKDVNALTFATKFGILITASSDFQIVAGILMILSIVMGYIIIKEVRDLLQL